MKKKLLFASIVLLSVGGGEIKAQKVGVNVDTPTEILDVSGTARVRELPLDGATNSIYTTGANTTGATKTQTFTAASVVLSDANNVIGRQTKEKFRDEMNRISIEKIGSGANLSTLQPHELKDIYVIDNGTITLPRCSAAYEGKVLQFYKWGGQGGTWRLTTGSVDGGIHNATTAVGFNFPTGVSYSNNALVFNNANLSDVGFRMIRLICITGDNKWFADFGFR